MRTFLTALLILATAGCASTQRINHPDGTAEFLVACGADTDWTVCHQRANEVCPRGYVTLSEAAGFNREELRFACPSSQVKG